MRLKMQSLASWSAPVLAVLLSLGTLGNLPLVSGSTDGRQLPAYFCNLARLPENPTTLGGFIALFKLTTNPGPPTLQNGFSEACGHPLESGTVSETQQLMASWHSSDAPNTRITDITNPIQISVRGTVPSTSSPTITPVPPGQLYRGALHALSVQSTIDGFFDINTELDGAVIYASLNSSDLNRVGSFVNTGPNMASWLACGLNNVGVVQTQVMSDSGTYPDYLEDSNGNALPSPPSAGLIWQAPNLPAGTGITFKGHGVTGVGFGPFYPIIHSGQPPDWLRSQKQSGQCLDMTINVVLT